MTHIYNETQNILSLSWHCNRVQICM